MSKFDIKKKNKYVVASWMASRVAPLMVRGLSHWCVFPTPGWPLATHTLPSGQPRTMAIGPATPFALATPRSTIRATTMRPLARSHTAVPSMPQCPLFRATPPPPSTSPICHGESTKLSLIPNPLPRGSRETTSIHRIPAIIHPHYSCHHRAEPWWRVLPYIFLKFLKKIITDLLSNFGDKYWPLIYATNFLW